MPEYLPVSWIKPANASDIAVPALFTPSQAGLPRLLVTGGEDPQAIVLDDVRAGRSFRVKQVTNRPGYIVDDIEFCVDPTSLADSRNASYKPLSLAVFSDGIYVLAVTSNHGFEDLFAWSVLEGSGKEYFTEALVFSRWKIQRRLERDWIEIASFSAVEPS